MVLGAVLFGMNGCALYGKFKPQTTAEDETIQVPDYKDIFTDPYLCALIDTALAHNLDLKIAHERVRQAEATLLGAKLAYLPSIYAGGNGAVTMPGPAYTFATASWEIDIFGRLTNQKRMANAAKLQTEDLERACRAQLIASVAETYYELLMYDAQILKADSAASNWERSVMTMREMKAAGMYDEAAVTQFEGSWYATRAQAKALCLCRVQAENAMRLLLCQKDGEIRRGSLEMKTTELLFDTIDLRAVRTRPDVKAAEHVLEQAFYNRNYARSCWCPSISLSGALGWADGGLIYNAVANLMQPVLNSGRNIAQLRAAKSQLEEMQMAYAKILLQAGTEVNDALAARNSHIAQTIEYYNQSQAMMRALDATQTKMRLGKGTYLEVLIAQNNLLDAQLTLIANYRAILQSQVQLFLAVGGGK